MNLSLSSRQCKKAHAVRHGCYTLLGGDDTTNGFFNHYTSKSAKFPSTIGAQRSHRVGCCLFSPTAGEITQQRSHFSPDAGCISTKIRSTSPETGDISTSETI